MQPTPLTKLRLSFLALGATLFVALVWLIHSVNVRVEAQRRLRHQVVAERIFDELERELTRVLGEEASRPSQAFDGKGPDAAFPYVIGYFRTEGDAPVLLQTPSGEAAARLTQALAVASVGTNTPAQVQRADDYVKSSAKPVPTPPPARGSLSPGEILRKLNRASEERRDWGAR